MQSSSDKKDKKDKKAKKDKKDKMTEGYGADKMTVMTLNSSSVLLVQQLTYESMAK